jgi:hypothetical protein
MALTVIKPSGIDISGNYTVNGMNVSANLSAANLSVTTSANLGAVGNIVITGGTANYVLKTDGAGNLSWTAQSGGNTANVTVDNFTGNGVQTIFTLSTTPIGINQTSVNYNGATVLRTDYTLANANITFSSAPANGSYIEVTTIDLTGGGGSGSPGGANTQVQFNDAGAFAGNTGFTFNKTTGIFTALYLAGTGNGLSNIQGANVSGAVGTAGTVTTNAQPNITSVGTLTSLTVNGNISANNANITGNIVPTSNNIYSLGSASSYWKDAFIGPGSLYINGVKVLEESSNAIVISADLNQTVKVTSSGSGDIQLQTTGTGVIAVKGPLQIQAGNYITSSNGGPIGFSNPINVDTLSSLSANTNLTISANGTGNIQLNDDVTITGNLTVTGVGGNLSVTSLTVEDNIIDISAETTGVPVNNAGIRVIRGDDPAVQLRWNESSDTWQVTNDGSIYFNIVGSNTTTGNANVGNIGATSGIFTNVSGNGSALTSITGANVTGAVSYATTANSVAVANVSGIGNIATTNYNGNGSQVLAGNGAWVNSSGGGGTSAAAAVGYSLIFGG